MRKFASRFLFVGVVAALMLVVLAGAAFAQAPPTPAEVVGDAATDVVAQILDVLVVVIPAAAGILAVTVGWRFVRRMISGNA